MSLIKKLKIYSVNQPFGTQKLANYFFVMAYFYAHCKTKRIFLVHFNEFWQFFQSKLAEPAIAIHQNKQGFLQFWFLACQECPEVIKAIVQTSHIYKKIAFNYILADHEDQDTILFNKNMLPYYYGILRLCCNQSRPFARYLSMHQNIMWAFQNITPYQNHYQLAVQELFRLMKLFITLSPEPTEDELKDVSTFKKSTLKMYMSHLNPNVHWATLISVLNILVDSDDDRVFIIQNNGLYLLFQAFSALHIMFHEATACHINNELVDLLRIISSLLSVFESHTDHVDLIDHANHMKDFVDIKKFVFLLNTYTPQHVRNALFDVLGKLTRVLPNEFLKSVTHLLMGQHLVFHDHNCSFVSGPYFPKRGQKAFQNKSSIRPSRPIFQMCFSPSNLENCPTRDKEYERAVCDFYTPYYQLVEGMCRFAVKNNLVFNELVQLALKVATESVYFHYRSFIDLFLEVHKANNESEGSQYFDDYVQNSKHLRDYTASMLTRERNFLSDDQVYEFMSIYLLKVCLSLLCFI